MTETATPPAGSPASAAPTVSPWAPLARTVFRTLWFAQLGSNIGTWMQTVGAQWFLVETHADSVVIALVQTASLVPAVVFSLPAGALADSFDRRRLLIWGSAASAVLAIGLTLISATGGLNAPVLLGFTLVLGIASTLTSPAWQAIQPELVPREEVVAAAALGGVTVNGARAIGPALAGVVLSLFGTSVVFGINALSFVIALVALVWWRRPPQSGLDDRERFGAAMRAGIRYTLSAHLVRRILLRSVLFAFPASALWALLPLMATRLGLDSSGYGLLLGALDVGAVAGVFLLPVVRKRFSDNVVIAVSAVLFAGGTVAAAFAPFAVALPVLVVAGVAWIGTLTVLNAALQLTLPQWVRSRAVSIYILFFMGSMAVGSFAFGVLAQVAGTATSLVVAAVLLLLVAASVPLLPLLRGTGTIDRSIANSWPEPMLVFEPEPTDGPVLIEIAYRVREADRPAFETAIRHVGDSRRRTGGYRWRLYRSGEDSETLLETFLVPSWGEFARQRTQRFTGRDRELWEAARAYCEDDPVERHYFHAG